MAIINGPEKLSKDKIIESAKEYAKENSLTKEELDELIFICDSFVKYYNTLSNKSHSYSPKMVQESFDIMMNTVSKNWAGLSTRANLFYKQIPELEKIFTGDTLDTILNENKEISNSKNQRNRDLETIKTKNKSYISYNSYGSCGGYSDYGGPSC